MGGMSSRSTPGRRVRPLSVVILVVCLLLVVAALSAWRGSASQHGRIPEVRFATSTWHEDAAPYQWATLDDGGGDERQLERDISPDQVLTVGLPPELERTDLSVLVRRTPPGAAPEDAVEEVRQVPAGSTKTLTLPAEEEGTGLLTDVVVTSGPIPVYDADGDDSILLAEWSLALVPAPEDPATAPGAE